MNPDLEFEEYQDILTAHEIDQIHDILCSRSFPWFFSELSVAPSYYNRKKDENTREYLQLIHLFNTPDGTPNSNYNGLSDEILNRFLHVTGKSLKKRYKTKANFQTKIETFLPTQYNTPHIDERISHHVLIYYPHTTDGDTFIFDNTQSGYTCIKRITPKAGKYIFFNGAYYHAGSHPSQNDYRIVLSYNFALDE